MESWSFPPAYDQGFMPDTDSRYWFPERETMDPVEREAAIVGRIGQVMRYAYDHAPFTAKNGTTPASTRTASRASRTSSACRW